eukprot:CAMPEP_0181227880 /NCGR_PEP_ID=MMETSP1096-20121128/33030_1 /TAXON_ID=156174 ORGANISM="Chrysochromulina ericina, Strain CCMP281" /NCGR_SAMPLE_ID=MMETSP1096 /ASSEMBLY_ACC=CAM_ASM_000453 /LENGTH=251 /DNA_ID=CAMNT_0023321327 /DNA_START=32 /DNA_END=789 /DNA_ORIENTATION=-
MRAVQEMRGGGGASTSAGNDIKVMQLATELNCLFSMELLLGSQIIRDMVLMESETGKVRFLGEHPRQLEVIQAADLRAMVYKDGPYGILPRETWKVPYGPMDDQEDDQESKAAIATSSTGAGDGSISFASTGSPTSCQGQYRRHWHTTGVEAVVTLAWHRCQHGVSTWLSTVSDHNIACCALAIALRMPCRMSIAAFLHTHETATPGSSRASGHKGFHAPINRSGGRRKVSPPDAAYLRAVEPEAAYLRGK